MLNTVIDFEVFEDFCKSQPKQIPIGSDEDHELWNSFWRYFKSGSNLSLSNYSGQENIFLNGLTTGRDGTSIKFDNVKTPHKFKFPKNQNVQTVFFLNEEETENQKKYRNNNGLIFGFLNDYKEIWKDISFFEKETVLHDRKSVEDSKKFSWDKFSKSLLPFTDVIIRDDFLFKDIDEIEIKFGSIIRALSKNSNQKFNLVIVLNKFKLDNEFHQKLEEVNDYLLRKNYFKPERINLGFVHTSKEHDRYIFFNYLEVYFGKIPDSSTKPTKINFNPYTISNNYSDAKLVLKDLEKIIESAKSNNEFVGNISNKLLN